MNAIKPSGILHALYSLRAEGCPRLAYDLLDQEIKQRSRRGSVAILDPQDDLRTEFEGLGVSITQLTWKRRNYVALYRQFLKLLRQEKPAGVILYPLGAHLPMTWACQRLGIPHVVHLACLPPWRDPIGLQKIRIQMWAGLASTQSYAACSQRVAQDSISAYRLPANRVQAIYNGISLERFGQLRATRQPWQPASNRPLIIGMTGSLEVSKDHPTLLRAVALLKQQGKPIRLRLVGGGSQAGALQQQASDLGIADIVDWTGSVNNIVAELAMFDVYAFSAKPEEGLGIALIEAIASGLPALATDIPAVREIFRHYPQGVVVPFSDAATMAEGLWQVWQRPAAPPEALEPFDVAETFRQYEALLASHRPPARRASKGTSRYGDTYQCQR